MFAVPEFITIGEDRVATTFARRFSGEMLGIERLDFSTPADFNENWGMLEMALTFPAEAGMKRETLISTGKGATTDILSVVYDGANRIHFVVSTARGTSSPVRWCS